MSLTYKCLESHSCMSHVTYICLTDVSHVSHSHIYSWRARVAVDSSKVALLFTRQHFLRLIPGDAWHVSILSGTWLICMCDTTHFVRVISPFVLTHLHAWHDCSWWCVTCLNSRWVWLDSLACVTRLIRTCDITPFFNVWHDSILFVDMTRRSYYIKVARLFTRLHLLRPAPGDTWHDSFICVTWLIYKCDMAPFVTWLIKYQYVM